MKRTELFLGGMLLALLVSPAFGGDEPKEPAKLTPELCRQLTEKVLALQDKSTATKELAASLQADVEQHRAELLGALTGGAGIERALAAALLHLAKSDQDKIAEALAKALSDEDLDVRRGAAGSLLRLKKPTSAEALIKALEDTDEQVRSAAAAALGTMKIAKAKDGLVKLIEDPNWMVRLQAVQALGAVADKDSSKEVAEKLKGLLEDENAFVRMAAAGTITKLTGVKPEGAPDAGDKNVLHNLATEMGGVKEQLDGEHHGSTVQVAQKGISDKLDQLIKMIQEQQQQQQQSQSQGKPKEGEPKPGQPKSGPGNKGGKPQQGKPTSAATSEAMSEGSVKHGEKGSAEVSAVGGEWGNLPPKMREELELAKGEGLPERYRKLLEIYLMSIAEEEK
jgi:hypothetical protein